MTTLIVDDINANSTNEFIDHELFPVLSLAQNKYDKLTSAQLNKIGAELKKPRRPTHSNERIKSAPQVGPNAKLKLIINGTGGRKIKSALVNVKRATFPIISQQEQDQKNPPNSGETSVLLNTRYTKIGQQIIDFKKQQQNKQVMQSAFLYFQINHHRKVMK